MWDRIGMLKDYSRTHTYIDFVQEFGFPMNDHSKEFYDNLKISKSGMISIEKLTDNPNPYIEKGGVRMGHTDNFGEGLACYLTSPTEWFHTSSIEKINWEEGIFKTRNSVYRFTFEPDKPE